MKDGTQGSTGGAKGHKNAIGTPYPTTSKPLSVQRGKVKVMKNGGGKSSYKHDGSTGGRSGGSRKGY